MTPAAYLLPLVSTLAFSVQTAVGFAAALLCLSLGAQVYPLRPLVVAVAAASCLQGLTIVLRHHRHVDARRLLAVALPLGGVGLLLGLWLRSHLTATWLRTAFALFVMGAAAVGIATRLWKRAPERRTHGRASASWAYLLPGGLVHGLFATGGPLVVLWANEAFETKERFRASLAALWLCANTVLVASAFVSGEWSGSSLEALALLLPGLLLGLVIGEYLHARVPERVFRLGVQGLLFVAGLSLLA